CGGRDRQTRDTEHPGECRRSHISFPCVPPWLGKIRVPDLSEPHSDCQEGSHFLYGGSCSRRTNNNDPPFTVKLWGRTKVFVLTFRGRKPLILSTVIAVFQPPSLFVLLALPTDLLTLKWRPTAYYFLSDMNTIFVPSRLQAGSRLLCSSLLIFTPPSLR